MFDTVGFDVNEKKISELRQGTDKMKEISYETLVTTKLNYTADPKDISGCDFIVIAVPTPIDEGFKPDLRYLKAASEVVGKNLSKNSIVVYESTVYPGCTEEVCIPVIEKESGLKCGTDFKVGYSPERINPGDKEHTVDKIIKIVSGTDEESLNTISEVYSKIIKAGVFKASNIKTAEAAKVIENIQRDLNISLVNELSLIFGKMGVNTIEVLDAAGTKWNFHKYKPGLVGGHCIGVDPYYLTYKAEQLGFHPRVILAGRHTNEYMSKHVANQVLTSLNLAGKVLKDSTVLIMGLTFKENVGDARNSKAKDLIKHLKEFNVNVMAYDPLLSKEEVKQLFDVENIDFNNIDKIDAAVLATPHEQFKNIPLESLKTKMDKPILIDVKSFYNKKNAEELGFIYKCL